VTKTESTVIITVSLDVKPPLSVTVSSKRKTLFNKAFILHSGDCGLVNKEEGPEIFVHEHLAILPSGS
jgi:hypothetical protein